MMMEEFLTKLDGVKKQGSGWVARCPAHDDRQPSLSIAEGTDGRIMLFCHAGCSFATVCDAANISQRDCFADGRAQQPRKRIAATYDYRDESGKLLFQTVRYDPKEFQQRRPDENGGWIWNLKDTRRVLYRLPELLAADKEATIFICEGEADVDRLWASGLVATTNAMGAGAKKNNFNWREEYNAPLAGRPVVVIPDNDQPGHDHAQAVARSVKGVAASIKVLPLPGVPEHGGDVRDWLSFGGTIDTLRAMAEAAPEWTPCADKNGNGKAPRSESEETGPYACVRMSEVKAEKVEWLWKPYLPLGKITLLDGWPGIGKSWLTCKFAAIVTRGGGFPNSTPFAPGNVLMLSAEDGLSDTLRPRLDACGADVDKVIALNILEKDGLATFTESGLVRFETTIIEYRPTLVIVDPLFAFTGGDVDIHRANECRKISATLAAIAARQRVNLLCVRHLGKSGGQGSPMKAGIGSIDWIAAARVGLLAGCDPDDSSKLALTNYKNNLARMGAPLGYKIDFDQETDWGTFSWTGISDLTAERILSPANREGDDEAEQKRDAAAFLSELFKDGEVEAKEVEKARRSAGISDYALRKAKASLRIKVRAEKQDGTFAGPVRWYWSLPAEGVEVPEAPAEGVEEKSVQRLPSNGSDKSSYGNNLAEGVDGNSFQRLPRVQPPFSTPSDDDVEVF